MRGKQLLVLLADKQTRNILHMTLKLIQKILNTGLECCDCAISTPSKDKAWGILFAGLLVHNTGHADVVPLVDLSHTMTVVLLLEPVNTKIQTWFFDQAYHIRTVLSLLTVSMAPMGSFTQQTYSTLRPCNTEHSLYKGMEDAIKECHQ